MLTLVFLQFIYDNLVNIYGWITIPRMCVNLQRLSMWILHNNLSLTRKTRQHWSQVRAPKDNSTLYILDKKQLGKQSEPLCIMWILMRSEFGKIVVTIIRVKPCYLCMERFSTIVYHMQGLSTPQFIQHFNLITVELSQLFHQSIFEP